MEPAGRQRLPVDRDGDACRHRTVLSAGNVSWCEWSPRAYSSGRRHFPRHSQRRRASRHRGKRRLTPWRMVRQFSCMEAYARDELNCVPPSAAIVPHAARSNFKRRRVVDQCRRRDAIQQPALHRQPHEELPHIGLAGSANGGGDKARKQDVSRTAVQKVTLSVVHPARPVHPGGRNRSPIVAALSDPTGRWTQPWLYRVEV